MAACTQATIDVYNLASINVAVIAESYVLDVTHGIPMELQRRNFERLVKAVEEMRAAAEEYRTMKTAERLQYKAVAFEIAA